MVSEPLDALLAKGEAQLKADNEAAVQTAQFIDPRRTAAQVMEAMQLGPSDGEGPHPGGAPLARGRAPVRRVSKNLVSFPSEVRPKVEPTPPYARNGSFASLDAPGPYETKATESYYYVTPPEETGTARRSRSTSAPSPRRSWR